METILTSRPTPRWYTAAAIASLLFMLIGIAGFVMDMITDPQALAPEQRALMLARPEWMKIAYGIAVWSGLIGAVLLLMRRRLADPTLLVSLIATVFTFLPYAVVPTVQAVIARSDVIAGVVVIAVMILIYAFASRARRQGWLR